MCSKGGTTFDYRIVIWSFSFLFLPAISKDEAEEVGNKFRCNGYSEEFLDRIEPNGNILRAKQHSSTSDARIGK
jgi:hypothetical protein